MTDLLALLAAYGSASCTPSAGGRAGTEPNECTADAREQCKAFPCIDLREADNHHHPMWLNSPGNAGVMYYREDGSGAARRVVEAALARRSADNISAVVVDLRACVNVNADAGADGWGCA